MSAQAAAPTLRAPPRSGHEMRRAVAATLHPAEAEALMATTSHMSEHALRKMFKKLV
jgi:hypothetical protein